MTDILDDLRGLDHPVNRADIDEITHLRAETAEAAAKHTKTDLGNLIRSCRRFFRYPSGRHHSRLETITDKLAKRYVTQEKSDE